MQVGVLVCDHWYDCGVGIDVVLVEEVLDVDVDEVVEVEEVVDVLDVDDVVDVEDVEEVVE
ncbi:MAG: hypothetical protein KGH77_06245, partial [Candidatus Micrarchaeota archaeon]|nr:hypothetical protein [Candidatus Micrarchaeota archaeon]